MRISKKWFILLMSSMMVILLLPSMAIAAESEICGKYSRDEVYWNLDDNGTLTISGSGEMKDYYSKGEYVYEDEVHADGIIYALAP